MDYTKLCTRYVRGLYQWRKSRFSYSCDVRMPSRPASDLARSSEPTLLAHLYLDSRSRAKSLRGGFFDKSLAVIDSKLLQDVFFSSGYSEIGN